MICFIIIWIFSLICVSTVFVNDIWTACDSELLFIKMS